MSDSRSPTEYFEARYVAPAQGRTLIVGSKVFGTKEDRRKRYADVLGVDMQPGDGVDMVLDLEQPLPDGFGKFAHVECISVLEHSRKPWLMARNIEKLMQKGATIFVAAPFVWRVHGYPSDYWRFTRDGIAELFQSITWHRLAYAHNELKLNDIVTTADIDGHPYLARTEVLGFGVRE